VTLEQITVNPNITINPTTGAVTVAAGTQAGVYTINYKITDKLNPTNTANANVVVTVNSPSILAVNDAITIDGKSNVVAINNIVANDFLNDQLTNLNNVIIKEVVTGNPNIIVDVATGSLTVNKAILAGVYVVDYTIQDKSNLALTSSAKVTITVNPNPVVGLSKAVSAVNKELDGSYTLNYTLNAQNYGNINLTAIEVADDLVKAFPLPISFTIVGSINVTGSLVANQNFNGTTNLNLLGTGSVLAPNQKESISFSVNIKLNNTADTLFNNKALVTANSLGIIISDESTNGREPDENLDGNPQENAATPIVLKKSNIRIPQGFSPNNDGVHDKFVIENTTGDVVSLEIFNRWGNVVYRNDDYKNDWSGKSNQGITIGEDLPDGTYYYIVKVNGKDKYVKYLTIKR
ncbi:gliding motility-associated C-terminal domain-containing protein, partial [Pedobacter alpinus]